MRKIILSVIFILLSSTLILGQARDPFDSFDNFNQYKIAIIVAGADTSALPTDSYGLAWYRYFDYLNFNTMRIDTSHCDLATYDGVNNWTDFDFAVFIPTSDYDSCTVDTTDVGGIGDIPVIIMKSTMTQEFGFPKAHAVTLIDTAKFGSDTTSFPLNYCSIKGYVPLYENTTIYGILNDDSLANESNNLAWGVYEGIDSLVIVAYDTLNGQNRLFVAGNNVYPYTYSPYVYAYTKAGLINASYVDYDILTPLNKIVSTFIGTDSDSLFYLAGGGAADYILKIDLVKCWLEMNGHRTAEADIKYNGTYGDDTRYGYIDSTTYNSNTNNGWNTIDAGFFLTNAITNYIHYSHLDTLLDRGFALAGSAIKYVLNSPEFGEDGDYYLAPSATVEPDTLYVEMTSHSMATDGTTLNDTLLLHNSPIGTYSYYYNENINLSTFGTIKINGGNKPYVVIEKGERRVAFASGGGYITNLYMGNWADDYWDLICNIFGWILDTGMVGNPTNVSITVLNTDSVSVTWTDNEANEDNYGIYMYYCGEDSNFWYTTSLAVNTEIDTIAPIWPPNSFVVVDVACIAGNDTLYSGSPDTAYTFASIPPSPYLEAVSDSSIFFNINGYIFRDAFTDTAELRGTNAIWTEVSGTWDNDYPNQTAETESDAGKLATAYTNLIQDVEFQMTYAFIDTVLFTSQNIQYHVVANTINLNDDGYYVYIESDSIFFKRLDNNVATILISASLADAENSHWHDVRVTRDWKESPIDTTVLWTLYFDGTSKGTSGDETYNAVTHLGIVASTAGQYFDNFFVRGLTPSANHALTDYAVQEAILTTYVDYTAAQDTLAVTASWGIFSEWGSNDGDTLVGLNPATTYYLRTKAKSGR